MKKPKEAAKREPVTYKYKPVDEKTAEIVEEEVELKKWAEWEEMIKTKEELGAERGLWKAQWVNDPPYGMDFAKIPVEPPSMMMSLRLALWLLPLLQSETDLLREEGLLEEAEAFIQSARDADESKGS